MTNGPPIHLWSISAPLTEMHGGHRARVFRTTGLERDLVFKTTTRSEAALGWLSQAYDLAESAGLVVPRLLPSAAGFLTEAGWTCEPFLDGDQLPPSQLGELETPIRRMQRAASGMPQRPSFQSARALIYSDKGGDIDLTQMPAALSAKCRTAFADLDATPETLVHGDLNASNVMRLNDGQLALIDWDEARLDHPVFDLGQFSSSDPTRQRALLAWEIACCWTREPDRARRLAAKL